jgi:hypothetical protein
VQPLASVASSLGPLVLGHPHVDQPTMLSHQGWSSVSTTIDRSAGFVEVLGSACSSDFEDRNADLGRDAFAIVEGRQPRQMIIALPSLAFSRIHHSVLVGRGSGASSFGTLGRTATWWEGLWCDSVMRRMDLFRWDGGANSCRGSKSDARAHTLVVVLDAHPPRLRAMANSMKNGSWRIGFYARVMVN